MTLYKYIYFFALFLVVLSICTDTMAAQRALLIGVGKYQIPNRDLPGIDVDIELMQAAMARIGFKKEEIRVLQDETATLANIRSAVSEWLVEDVKADERIVLYFGGHGSRIKDLNSDEKDHVDEVLLAHDTKLVNTESGRTLSNVIVDDEFAFWISKIPSKNILILVDACNSGTVTRSIKLNNFSLGVDTAIPKYFYYEDMPQGKNDSFIDEKAVRGLNKEGNYIALSAANDNEKALSTEQGSYFTLGVVDAINLAAKHETKITVLDIFTHAQGFIHRKVSSEHRYHPQINGNEMLAKGKFELITFAAGEGPVWKAVAHQSQRGDLLQLNTNKHNYTMGENIRINVKSKRPGYLNIISVDANDEATILYPNKFSTNNLLTTLSVTIPSDTMSYTFQTVEPIGLTLISAFITESPINLYELSIQGRNVDGMLDRAFANLSYSGLRAISNSNQNSVNNYLSNSTVVEISLK